MKRVLSMLALVAAAVVVLSGCVFDDGRRLGGEVFDNWTNEEFYQLPSDIPAGEPGELIRAKLITSAPLGTTAWRVIYHSRDMAGTDIPVSGVVIVPAIPAPEGGRVVVSWAHPTTGSAAACGPSLDMNPFSLIEGLDDLLASGYAVAATDYQGMGLEGESSYLLGETEGNNVLDAVRAAKNLPDSGIGSDLLLWGHSQGGQAALFAAQQASSYAPELSLKGVAVAAPAADLIALMDDDIIAASGVTIASYAIPAMTAAYSDRYALADLQGLLTPEGLAATSQIADLCLSTQAKEVHAIADPLVGSFVTSDPSTTEPWKTILTENSAGAAPITVPVYIAQGLGDTLVVPKATDGYVDLLCAAGSHVTYDTFDGVTHQLIALTAAPVVSLWFAGVLNGDPGKDNCRE